MDTYTTATANYDFAVLSGGASLRVSGCVFHNVGFSSGRIVNAVGPAAFNVTTSEFSTVVSTSGGGVLFSSALETITEIMIFISGCNFSNITAPLAAQGGVIYIANTSEAVVITNISGIVKAVNYCFCCFC
jgi:hypothetical protein